MIKHNSLPPDHFSLGGDFLSRSGCLLTENSENAKIRPTSFALLAPIPGPDFFLFWELEHTRAFDYSRLRFPFPNVEEQGERRGFQATTSIEKMLLVLALGMITRSDPTWFTGVLLSEKKRPTENFLRFPSIDCYNRKRRMHKSLNRCNYAPSSFCQLLEEFCFFCSLQAVRTGT